MKRIISILLTLCLAFSFASIVASADTVQKGYLSVHGTVEGSKGYFAVELSFPYDVKDVSAIQFDVELPEGISMNSGVTTPLANGWVAESSNNRIILYNSQNKSISESNPIFANTYDILRVPVTIKSSVSPGDLEVVIKNIVVSELSKNAEFGNIDVSDSFEQESIGYITYLQDISGATIKGIIDKVYTGSARTQNPTVVLNGKTLSTSDYSISYSNNINSGIAKIIIKGRGGSSGYFGSVSKTFKITPPSVSGSLNVSASNVSSITLTWSKVSSKAADGYKIYRSNSLKGKYTLIKTISDVSVNSYKCSSLISGTTYYFKLCTYKKIDGKIYESSYIGRSKTTGGYKLTVPKNFKMSSQTTSSIKLTWKKNTTKIDGYSIYRSTKKDSGFKKIKTIKDTSVTSFTDKKLSAGKTYYYKISAFRKYNSETCVSGDALVTATTKTKAPSIKSLSPVKSKKMLVKWNKVLYASGYEVYMSTKKSSGFKKIYGGSKTSYTKSSLKKGTTYYFKVRTYKTVNGKKVYSAYSKIKYKKASK